MSLGKNLEIDPAEGPVRERIPVDSEDEGKVREERFKVMEAVLNMFGNDEARRKFEELLKAYRDIYMKSHAQSLVDVPRQEFGRSNTHNEIMAILQKLALTAKSGSLEEKALHEMGDRHKVHDFIVAYFEGLNKKRGVKYVSPMAEFRERGGA